MSETRLRIVPEDEPPQGQTLREATDEADRVWLDALWDILEGGIPSRLEAQTTMPPYGVAEHAYERGWRDACNDHLMQAKTVHETCSCGATFAYEGDQPHSAVADFRRNHRHAESVGICGDMAPPLLVDDTEIRSFCELKAGHTGAHSDGAGHWFHAETHPIVEAEAQG